MNKENFAIITKIIGRADDMDLLDFDRQALLMDMKIAFNELDLDLYKLLNFEDFDFTHDIVGIQNHVNRQEMTFDKTFLPRCAN